MKTKHIVLALTTALIVLWFMNRSTKSPEFPAPESIVVLEAPAPAEVSDPEPEPKPVALATNNGPFRMSVVVGKKGSVAPGKMPEDLKPPQDVLDSVSNRFSGIAEEGQ